MEKHKKLSDFYEPSVGPKVEGFEKRMMELMSGAEPQNEVEKKLLDEINKAIEEGVVIDIPTNL